MVEWRVQCAKNKKCGTKPFVILPLIRPLFGPLWMAGRAEAFKGAVVGVVAMAAPGWTARGAGWGEEQWEPIGVVAFKSGAGMGNAILCRRCPTKAVPTKAVPTKAVPEVARGNQR